MRRAALLLLAALAAPVAAPGPAEAVCVQNRAGQPLEVRQLTGGRFETIVEAGARACCDWRDRSCNVTGLPGDLVGVEIGPRGHFARQKAADAPAGCRITLEVAGTIAVRLDRFDIGGGRSRLGLRCEPVR